MELMALLSIYSRRFHRLNHPMWLFVGIWEVRPFVLNYLMV